MQNILRPSMLIAALALSGASAQADSGRASYFAARGLACAHKAYPVGTRLLVTNLVNHRSVVCVVSGRGPFVRGRIVDVSTAAAGVLGFRRAGVTSVQVDVAAR